MTLREFNGLSSSGKKDAVELWGDLITEKVYHGYQVKVYQLNNFYVEVYHGNTDQFIKKYRACVNKDTVCSTWG